MRPSEGSLRPTSYGASALQEERQAAQAAAARENGPLVHSPAPVLAAINKTTGPLIEFSTVKGEDPNEDVMFGETPQECKCPHCERKVLTFIDHETSVVTWVLAFVVWVSLGWMAFWVLPVLWPAFKDVVHHCPRCLNVIERRSRIKLPGFKTEVMTCKVGGCAVVLSRKYVAIMIGLVALIVSAYLLRSQIQMNTAQEHKGMASMLTWEDFIFDCGPRTQLSHRPSTALAFEERYRKRTFKWQGEVRIIREGFDVLFVRTKSLVMVQMFPPRFKGRPGDHPDVALLFGNELNRQVSDFMPGDWVEFEATMSAHGYRGDPEVMVLWKAKKVARPDPLSSSAGAMPEHQEEKHDVNENQDVNEKQDETNSAKALEPDMGGDTKGNIVDAPADDALKKGNDVDAPADDALKKGNDVDAPAGDALNKGDDVLRP